MTLSRGDLEHFSPSLCLTLFLIENDYQDCNGNLIYCAHVIPDSTHIDFPLQYIHGVSWFFNCCDCWSEGGQDRCEWNMRSLATFYVLFYLVIHRAYSRAGVLVRVKIGDNSEAQFCIILIGMLSCPYLRYSLDYLIYRRFHFHLQGWKTLSVHSSHLKKFDGFVTEGNLFSQVSSDIRENKLNLFAIKFGSVIDTLLSTISFILECFNPRPACHFVEYLPCFRKIVLNF